MRVRVYGDLHANFRLLHFITNKLLKDIDEVWIAGDFGYGFPSTFNTIVVPRIPVKFIRGNHDNPIVREDFNWKGFEYIKDGTIKDGVLFIGGAWSVDKEYRIPGVSWWDQEELNQPEMDEIEHSIEGKIDTVITHEAPYVMYPYLHPSLLFPNRTSEFLDHLRRKVLVGEMKPNLWIFGHHHKHLEKVIDGTRFVGLDVAETLDHLDLDVP